MSGFSARFGRGHFGLNRVNTSSDPTKSVVNTEYLTNTFAPPRRFDDVPSALLSAPPTPATNFTLAKQTNTPLVHGPQASLLRKFATPESPIDAERRKSKIEAPPQVLANYKRQVYDDMLSKAATAEERLAIEIARKQYVDQHITAQVNEEFSKSFQNWILKRGRREDHVRAGWWPEKDTNVPKFLSAGGLLSSHPSVRQYVKGFVLSRADFEHQLIEMKNDAKLCGVEDWPLDKLYLYYKYVVRGLDLDDEDLYMFAAPGVGAKTPAQSKLLPSAGGLGRAGGGDARGDGGGPEQGSRPDDRGDGDLVDASRGPLSSRFGQPDADVDADDDMFLDAAGQPRETDQELAQRVEREARATEKAKQQQEKAEREERKRIKATGRELNFLENEIRRAHADAKAGKMESSRIDELDTRRHSISPVTAEHIERHKEAADAIISLERYADFVEHIDDAETFGRMSDAVVDALYPSREALREAYEKHSENLREYMSDEFLDDETRTRVSEVLVAALDVVDRTIAREEPDDESGSDSEGSTGSRFSDSGDDDDSGTDTMPNSPRAQAPASTLAPAPESAVTQRAVLSPRSLAAARAAADREFEAKQSEAKAIELAQAEELKRSKRIAELEAKKKEEERLRAETEEIKARTARAKAENDARIDALLDAEKAKKVEADAKAAVERYKAIIAPVLIPGADLGLQHLEVVQRAVDQLAKLHEAVPSALPAGIADELPQLKKFVAEKIAAKKPKNAAAKPEEKSGDGKASVKTEQAVEKKVEKATVQPAESPRSVLASTSAAEYSPELKAEMAKKADQAQLAAAHARVAELEQQVGDKGKEKAASSSDLPTIEQLVDKIATLEKRLAEKSAAIKEVAQTGDEMKADAEREAEEAKNARKIAEAERELEKINSKITAEQVNDFAKTADAAVKAAEQEAAEAKEAARVQQEQLQAHAKDLQRQLQQNAERVHALERELSAARTGAQSTEDGARLKAQLQKAEAEMAQLRADNQRLSQAAAAANSSMNVGPEQREATARLKRTIEVLQKNTAQLEAEKRAIEARFEEGGRRLSQFTVDQLNQAKAREAEVRVVAERLEQLATQQARQLEEEERVRKLAEENAARADEERRRVAASAEEERRLMAEHRQLFEEQRRALAEELAEARNKYSELRDEVNVREAAIQEAEQRQRAVPSENIAEKAKLKHAIDILRSGKAEVERRLAGSAAANEQMEETIRDLQDRLTRARTAAETTVALRQLVEIDRPVAYKAPDHKRRAGAPSSDQPLLSQMSGPSAPDPTPWLTSAYSAVEQHGRGSEGAFSAASANLASMAARAEQALRGPASGQRYGSKHALSSRDPLPPIRSKVTQRYQISEAEKRRIEAQRREDASRAEAAKTAEELLEYVRRKSSRIAEKPPVNYNPKRPHSSK